MYTASSTVGTDTVKVTDTDGNQASTTVTGLGAPGLWLKADTGVTSSGGSVSNWADQSGNGNDFSQSNGAMQPSLSTFNSYQAIQFNGTTHGLAKSGATNLDLGNDSSVFFVLQTTGCNGGSTNVQNTFLFQGSGVVSAGTYFTSAYCPNAANTSGALGLARPWGASGTESSVVGYGSGTALLQGSVFSTIVNGSVGSYFAGGTSVGSAGNIGTGGSTAVTTIGFIVNGGGVNTNGGSNDYYMQGYVLEVLAYTSAISSTRSVAECYLSTKYNLSVPGC